MKTDFKSLHTVFSMSNHSNGSVLATAVLIFIFDSVCCLMLAPLQKCYSNATNRKRDHLFMSAWTDDFPKIMLFIRLVHWFCTLCNCAEKIVESLNLGCENRPILCLHGKVWGSQLAHNKSSKPPDDQCDLGCILGIILSLTFMFGDVNRVCWWCGILLHTHCLRKRKQSTVLCPEEVNGKSMS